MATRAASRTNRIREGGPAGVRVVRWDAAATRVQSGGDSRPNGRCHGSIGHRLARRPGKLRSTGKISRVDPNAAIGRNQSRLGLRPDPVGTESQPTKMRARCMHLTTGADRDTKTIAVSKSHRFRSALGTYQIRRGCEEIGTGTFATAGFPGFSPSLLGASPIFSQPVAISTSPRRSPFSVRLAWHPRVPTAR
jgi:hypothetical protein